MYASTYRIHLSVMSFAEWIIGLIASELFKRKGHHCDLKKKIENPLDFPNRAVSLPLPELYSLMHEHLNNSMVLNTVKHILKRALQHFLFRAPVRYGSSMPELAGSPAGELCICSLREAPPRFQNVPAVIRTPSLCFPACAFLPVTPLPMTKLSVRHKTFSQRGGAIGLGVRNAPTRLHRAEGAALARAEPQTSGSLCLPHTGLAANPK